MSSSVTILHLYLNAFSLLLGVNVYKIITNNVHWFSIIKKKPQQQQQQIQQQQHLHDLHDKRFAHRRQP